MHQTPNTRHVIQSTPSRVAAAAAANSQHDRPQLYTSTAAQQQNIILVIFHVVQHGVSTCHCTGYPTLMALVTLCSSSPFMCDLISQRS